MKTTNTSEEEFIKWWKELTPYTQASKSPTGRIPLSNKEVLELYTKEHPQTEEERFQLIQQALDLTGTPDAPVMDQIFNR